MTTKGLQITKPKRAHKSKKDQKKKVTTRIIEGGFVERTRKPATQGENLKSQLIRVDAKFAQWLREEAMKSGQSITDVTRILYMDLSANVQE